MEQLRFSYDGLTASNSGAYAIAGVVASGDLEVLMEREELGGRCEVIIRTSVQGFEKTWSAVAQSFVSARALANTRITINDSGATPAVVNLRLAQAARTLDEGNA
ncbi:MAG TPA: malonate decarboxylase acyl carrier protein [Burkholderiales bacterium]|jgi:malonate decarboxylase delta subunit|nr:malonate decarboxylase acyl carrier protein [Burkholderiales bacterium]